MTTTIKAHIIGDLQGENYMIDIVQDKDSSTYKVRLNYSVGDYYKTEKENIYPTIEQANRRFRFLARSVKS